MLRPCQAILGLITAVLLTSSVVLAYDGWGADTVGGSAATTTITVTSLADSGAGTLRAAFATADSLTSQSTNCATTGVLINFSVSGTITLASELRLQNAGCVTLDGNGAITLTADELVMRDSANVVLDGMRSRESGSGNDGFRFQNVDLGVMINNSCFDAGDECYSIVDGSTNISFLDNICGYDNSSIQRCLLVLQFPSGPAVENVTVARNLFVDAEQRSPQLASGSRTDVYNNLIAEWGRGTASGEGTRLVNGSGNVQNNLYWKFSGDQEDDALVLQSGSWHISGNDSVGQDPQDVNALSNSSQFSTPSAYQVNVVDAADVACLVSGQAGARPLDSIDESIVAEFSADCDETPPAPPGLDAVQDASLDENSPNKNDPSSTQLRIRSWDASAGGAQDNLRVLVQFDLSGFSGTIENAYLELCLMKINSDQSDIEIAAHRVTTEWDDAVVTAIHARAGSQTVVHPDRMDIVPSDISVTRQNQLPIEWDTFFGDFDSTATDTITVNKTVDGTLPNVYKSWDVTSDVQAMIDGTVPNYGWLLKHGTEGGSSRRTDWVSSEGTQTNCGEESTPRLVIIQ